jgi:hypothetical protein
MLGEILAAILFAPFAFAPAFFGGAAAGVVDVPTSGASNGTMSDAPQAHLAFFPAIAGFHVKILPQSPQENLGPTTCSIIHP